MLKRSMPPKHHTSSMYKLAQMTQLNRPECKPCELWQHDSCSQPLPSSGWAAWWPQIRRAFPCQGGPVFYHQGPRPTCTPLWLCTSVSAEDREPRAGPALGLNICQRAQGALRCSSPPT